MAGTEAEADAEAEAETDAEAEAEAEGEGEAGQAAVAACGVECHTSPITGSPAGRVPVQQGGEA